MDSSQSTLEKNISRDFPKREPLEKESIKSLLNTVKNVNAEGNMKKWTYMPPHVALYSFVTSFPLILGTILSSSTITSYSSENEGTAGAENIKEIQTVLADDASAQTTGWLHFLANIDYEMLMNYQLNYSALLLVAYGTIHLGLSLADNNNNETVNDRKEPTGMNTSDKNSNIVTQSDSAVLNTLNRWKRTLLALYPMGFAFTSFNLPVLSASVLLILGHIISAAMDSWVSTQGLVPKWYTTMRISNCLIICLSIALSTFFFLFRSALDSLDKETKELNTGTKKNETSPESNKTKERPKRPTMNVLRKRTASTDFKDNEDKKDVEEEEGEINFEEELKKI
jgi:hypothetical protein